jgi:hypothetical protein
MKRVPLLLILVAAVLLAPAGADAQYFGRNKVQWEDFDFKTLKTDHFDIYYYDEEEQVVEDFGRQAERWYSRLSRVFNHEFGRKPIVLYASSADFQQTTTTGGLIPEGTGGFTDQFQNRIVMPLTGSYADNDHVLGHEMVHVFQYDIAATGGGAQNRRFALQALPLWIVEGLAEYLSKGRNDPLTAMWMRDAMTRNRLPNLRQLNTDPRYFPYRYGQAFFAYMGARFGDDAVIDYFRAAGLVGMEDAFQRVLGIEHEQFFREWHDATRELYQPVIDDNRFQSLGEPILSREKTGGDLNIGPAISPDGRWVAFLSTREFFSIDLFLADAVTGRIVRRLVSSEGNPHFDALRFIDSGGAWSPDSRRIAVVTFSRGDNGLALIDAERGGVERRITIPGVGALSNPAWSPDGRTIVVSGQVDGVTDLYAYDIESNAVTQLTNDKFADLHPSWSADGTRVAFASDRGAGEAISNLAYDDLRIFTIDVQSRAVTPVELFPGGKHINPQFGPDGSLYFIANPEGVPDIYRRSPNGTIQQITRVTTGVSGITDLSPALTVALRDGAVLFSFFEQNRYSVYRLDPSRTFSTVTTALPRGTPRAALLPPAVPTIATSVTSYLQRPEEGLPPADVDFPVEPYKADLRLTYLGPPSLGVGADRFGYGVGGSISAYFSDVLGEHNVGFTFQGGSGSSLATTFGGELFYLNQENRVNWGGQARYIPYVSTATFAYTDVVTIDGQQVVADILEQQREIVTVAEATAISQYPFSVTRRFELNAGYQRLGFTREVQRQFYVGGRLVDDRTFDLEAPESLNLFRSAAAFVGDSSLFGFISPVAGTRYRFEAEALTGDLNFTTGLADYRKYFYRRPFTFAVRGLHYGRYGDDSENERIAPLNIGSGTLVRGYDIGSINLRECVRPSGSQACPVFDRLIGSKLGVASAELRVPLFGVRELGLISGAFLPTELVLFGDAGVAWTENEKPELKFETDTLERVPVFSVGVAARILLSYIPIEVYYAKPFQRPDEGWQFGFNISPGW